MRKTQVETPPEFEGSLASRYAELQEQMNTVHDGQQLRSAAELVLSDIPRGPVVLYSMSEQGAGLAAACAALRTDETLWARIHLAYPPVAPAGYAIVIVEPIAGGAAWLESLRNLYPGARVVAANELKMTTKLAA